MEKPCEHEEFECLYPDCDDLGGCLMHAPAYSEWCVDCGAVFVYAKQKWLLPKEAGAGRNPIKVEIELNNMQELLHGYSQYIKNEMAERYMNRSQLAEETALVAYVEELIERAQESQKTSTIGNSLP